MKRVYETSTGYQNEHLYYLLNLQMKQVYHQENNDKSTFSKSSKEQNIFDSQRTWSSIYANNLGIPILLNKGDIYCGGDTFIQF